jgi:hypothetical protein
MKVSNIKHIQKIDPEDIQQAKGDAARETMRKSLINKFIWWSMKEKKRFSAINNEEKIIVKRQYAYGRLLMAFGAFANFAIYNCFMTGIYNFRTYELLDTRRIPFAIKFSLSTAIAGYMCYKLW